jgi:hypothetical protein
MAFEKITPRLSPRRLLARVGGHIGESSVFVNLTPNRPNFRMASSGQDWTTHGCRIFGFTESLEQIISTIQDYADCAARAGVATPLMISHRPSGTSNVSIGNHIIIVIGPLRNPAACKGRPITSRTDATRPTQASGMGIIRPRKRR